MNCSCTTRIISKIAVEYQGDDRGTAELLYENLLLGRTPEQVYSELKAMADKNKNVTNWALTGYVSVPAELGKISKTLLTELTMEALQKIGISENNAGMIHLHSSTKNPHAHFLFSRNDINGFCSVKAHRIGERFGAALREACRERNLLTDIEIGVAKRASLLEKLKEGLVESRSFEDLKNKLGDKGVLLTISSNVKDGISGLRLVFENDINRQTERKYLPGYKLSEISSKLTVNDIKNYFAAKEALHQALFVSNRAEMKQILNNAGFKIFRSAKLGNALFIKPVVEQSKNGHFFARRTVRQLRRYYLGTQRN